MFNKKRLWACLLSAVMVLGTVAGPAAVWADETAPEAASQEAVVSSATEAAAEDLNRDAGTVYAPITYTALDGTVTTIAADTISTKMETADEITLTNSKGKATTAKFVKIKDLLDTITPTADIHGLIFETAKDSQSYSLKDISGTDADPFDGMYLYRVDGESCTYQTAKEGAEGMYWWSGITSIKETRDHLYVYHEQGGYYYCGMCKEHLTVSLSTPGGSGHLIYDDGINSYRSAGESKTITCGEEQITGTFFKFADLPASTFGISCWEMYCGVNFVDGEGKSHFFTVDELLDEENPVCMFNDSNDNYQYGIAVNGGGKDKRVKNVKECNLVYHDWQMDADGKTEICTACRAKRADFKISELDASTGKEKAEYCFPAEDIRKAFDGVEDDAVMYDRKYLKDGFNGISAPVLTLEEFLEKLDYNGPEICRDYVVSFVINGKAYNITTSWCNVLYNREADILSILYLDWAYGYVLCENVVSIAVREGTAKPEMLEDVYGAVFWRCLETDAGKFPFNRCYGENRYETAMKAADMYLAYQAEVGDGFSNQVILASGKNFPDALSAAALACAEGQPILMINDSNADVVIKHIDDMMPSDGKVTIIGGVNAVSKDIEKKINHPVERIEGADRYATNLSVLDSLGDKGDTLLISSGRNYADSLSASSTGIPMLLVNKTLNSDQTAWLKAHQFDRYVILGGEVAVTKDVEDGIAKIAGKAPERIDGTTRYDTSVEIAKKFYPEAKLMTLAYAGNFADALAAGPVANLYQSPVVLVTDDNHEAARELGHGGEDGDAYTAALVMGGTGVISRTTPKDIIPKYESPIAN